MTAIQLEASAPGSRNWAALLSPREAEVLRLVAAGRTNAEVAQELSISMATVKTHVAKLLRKVRARDRVGLVVASYTSGFMAVPHRTNERPRCTSTARHRHWR
jgi:DNA-binding NarL/FixJ family response regulator